MKCKASQFIFCINGVWNFCCLPWSRAKFLNQDSIVKKKKNILGVKWENRGNIRKHPKQC